MRYTFPSAAASRSVTSGELHEWDERFLSGQTYLKHPSSLLGIKTAGHARSLRPGIFGLVPNESKDILPSYYSLSAKYKSSFPDGLFPDDAAQALKGSRVQDTPQALSSQGCTNQLDHCAGERCRPHGKHGQAQPKE